jgi:hypothetical protein
MRARRCGWQSAAFVHLWLGLDAHLVHYPVKGGRLINIVAVVRDDWNETGWQAAGDRTEILRHFARPTKPATWSRSRSNGASGRCTTARSPSPAASAR